MQEEFYKTALAVYTPEEYAKIRALSEDADSMEETWEEWHQGANEAKVQAALQGIQCVEIAIDANGLVKYCLENNLAINSEARAGYAAWLLREREMRRIDALKKEESIEPEQIQESTSKRRERNYTPPVALLLKYAPARTGEALPKTDYIQKFGFEPEHIPELIRMATDPALWGEDTDEFKFGAVLHALYALGQLRAEEAIEPLLPLFDISDEEDIDWFFDIVPEVYGMIGPAALPRLAEFMDDQIHTGFVRGLASDAIKEIAKHHPEARAECIAAFSQALENSLRLTVIDENVPEFNGFVIADLIDLDAKEAAPIIERAFQQKRVDEIFVGDWNEVQYELGLKERPTPEERAQLASKIRKPISPESIEIMTPTGDFRPPNHSYFQVGKKQAGNKKNKVKMAKASKKANRKKK